MIHVQTPVCYRKFRHIQAFKIFIGLKKIKKYKKNQKILKNKKIDNKARISKKAKTKRKFNRSQKRITPWTTR